jgi:hypothetical protein
MAAAPGHDLLADTRQRDQFRLISVVLLFALLTGRTRVLWKSSRQDDEWEIGRPAPAIFQWIGVWYSLQDDNWL